MSLLYFFESIRNPFLDFIFSIVTLCGEETVFMAVGMIAFWCFGKYRGYYLLCTGFAGTVINQMLKMVFRVPRPWVKDPSFTIVESAREAASGYSFPSGHTQSSVGLFGGLARAYKIKAVRIIAITLCVLTPLSRMYLGVHTPADVLVSVVDFSENFYYDLMRIISIFVGMVVLVVVIMIYYGGVIRRITRLARVVSVTAEGDIVTAIRGDGVDEIARLAENVEYMRSSIVENLEREKAAKEANVELITSMSHDIRTPLTVLLGYIEMMKGRNADEEMNEYITASERTAMRLKELSDGMFNYFLVYGRESSSEPLSAFGASILFDQLISEFDLLFRERGYTVLRETTPAAEAAYSEYDVLTDAPETMRVVENIFSNIGKYADKNEPIVISIDFNEEKYKLKFTNKVAKDCFGAESNGIGLKTCRKIAERIFAGFEAERVDDCFVVSIELITVKTETEE